MASSTAETVESQRIWLWQQFAARVTPSVQRVVEFAKRVPGFCELSQDDQLILIKVGFFEVWLSHIAKMTSDNSMTFEDGIYITRQQLELMYEVRVFDTSKPEKKKKNEQNIAYIVNNLQNKNSIYSSIFSRISCLL